MTTARRNLSFRAKLNVAASDEKNESLSRRRRRRRESTRVEDDAFRTKVSRAKVSFARRAFPIRLSLCSDPSLSSSHPCPPRLVSTLLASCATARPSRYPSRRRPLHRPDVAARVASSRDDGKSSRRTWCPWTADPESSPPWPPPRTRTPRTPPRWGRPSRLVTMWMESCTRGAAESAASSKKETISSLERKAAHLEHARVLLLRAGRAWIPPRRARCARNAAGARR